MIYQTNPNFMRILADANDQATRAMAERYRDDLKARHLNAPRGGTRRNRRGQFRSAPGEVPAVDSGRLLKAMKVKRLEMMMGAWAFDLDDEQAKVIASFLEFGTRHMEPRPMFRSTLLQSRGSMAQQYAAIFRQRFK